MKTKFLLLVFLCGMMMSISAQEYQPQVGFSTENGSKVNFKKNKAGDNWVISLGGGANIYMGDQNSEADMGDRIGWSAALSIGKWYNPYLGFRLKLAGSKVNSFALLGADRSLENQELGLFGNAHLDLLWDITNYWAPYNEKKIVRFIPFIGMGYAIRPENTSDAGFFWKKSESPTINLGVQIPFRLSNRIDVFLEGEYTLLNEEFNRINMGHEEDRVVTAMLGFNFKLGRTNFEVIEPMDYDLLNDLNSQINALRAQNDELSRRPVSCPECPQIAPIVQESVEMMKNAVFFRLNSSVIDKNQEGNIYNTAEYAKKFNLPIKLVGYADKQTGTADYNYGLSERRARNVAKMLTEKHGIPTERISISWQGDREQPYGVNEWNRLVIMDTNK